MTRTSSWLASVGSLMMLWQECNENPAVFCYRIGWSLLAGQKAAQDSHGSNDEGTCSSLSNTSFTLYMTSKG